MKQQTFDKRLFSRDEAANYLAMSVRMLDTLRRERKIAARQQGKNIVFLREELDSYADSLENR